MGGRETIRAVPRAAQPLASVMLALILVATGRSDAAAAIAFVKTIGTAASKTTGISITVSVPMEGVAAGNSVIIAFAMQDPGTPGTPSASDSRNNTYNLDESVTNTNNVRTFVLSAHNVVGLASGDTITVTHPSVGARALNVSEFFGLAATAVLDRTATGTGNGTADPPLQPRPPRRPTSCSSVPSASRGRGPTASPLGRVTRRWQNRDDR